MKRVSPSGPRVAHAVALAAATSALALTIAGPGALEGPLLLVVLGVLLLPFLEWTSVRAGLASLLPRAVTLVLVAAGSIAWLSRAMGVLILEPALLPRVFGPVLVVAAVVFSIAPRVFPPGRALLPAVIGVLAVAGLDPRPDGYRATALSFLKGSEHTAFAEPYLALAIVVLLALWASAVLERGPRWRWQTAATLALSVMLAGLVAATGVIGLPLFQPHVEKAFASAFAEGTTGLGGETTLGDFASLAVSRRRVLDLQTSLPSGGAWLLPSEVFTSFDGKRWGNATASGTARPVGILRPTATRPPTGPLLEGLGDWFPVSPADGAPTVELRVTQAEVTNWPLLAPRGTRALTTVAHLLDVDRDGLVRRPPGDALRLYGVLWSPTRSAAPSLAPGARPEEPELTETLALPPRIDSRVAALARQLAEAPEPRGRVDAVINHLQTRYRYTLEPGAFRTDDPLAEFLFEKKAGYCEYFASAAVVLLRLQGVPARFVKGLAVGPHTDQGDGLHVVRESDAHAWVEAWVPDEGWVEADPTPPGDFMASRPRPSLLARLAQHARAALASAWMRLSVRGPVAFGRWLAGRVAALVAELVRAPLAWLALAATVLGRFALRAALARFRRRASAPPLDAAEAAVAADLRALVRVLEQRWAAAGRPRPTGRGLLEHALGLRDGGDSPLPPTVASTGPLVVGAYYRARFGGQATPAGDIESLREALRKEHRT